MINVKMLCDKEGCGKRNYVDTMISNLPSAFIVGKLWIVNWLVALTT